MNRTIKSEDEVGSSMEMGKGKGGRLFLYLRQNSILRDDTKKSIDK